jgi:hypothetical protein
MDSAVFNAMKRREEIREELADIDRFLKLYDRFKKQSDSPQGTLELRGVKTEQTSKQTESKAPQDDAAEAAAAQISSNRGWTREMLRPHLRRTILEEGRPLSRTQILKALDSQGIPVGGTDRAKNMGTIMWRLNDDFVSLEGFGYWPRNEPYPPAGYDPNDLNSPEAIKHTLGGDRPLDEQQGESEGLRKSG